MIPLEEMLRITQGGRSIHMELAVIGRVAQNIRDRTLFTPLHRTKYRKPSRFAEFCRMLLVLHPYRRTNSNATESLNGGFVARLALSSHLMHPPSESQHRSQSQLYDTHTGSGQLIKHPYTPRHLHKRGCKSNATGVPALA